MKTFEFICVSYDSFLPNETVKCGWSDSQSSSGDEVHEFMSSYETADTEQTLTQNRLQTSIFAL